MRLGLKTTCLLFFFATVVNAQDLPSAVALLDKTIAYHDPEGRWYELDHQIELQTKRPDGSARRLALQLNHASEMFGINFIQDGREIKSILKSGGECDHAIDGSVEFSEEDREKYRLTCERLTSQRDYYGYMLGLPMNLKDPGAILDPAAQRLEFEGQDVIALKVTYTEGVGSDTWYFYVHPETYALVGCRFYHDESKNDGEYLIFEGEAANNQFILPKVRKWYYNNNREFLGEDEVVSIKTGS